MMVPGMIHASVITVANNSFEAPSCGACYQPGGASWSFTSNAGEMGSGSLDNSTPSGSQTGWLQYLGGALQPEISQTLTGFTIGDIYNVSFDYAMRTSQADSIPVVVTMGANNLGTYTPVSSAWSSVTTSSFVATSTSYTLTFSGNFGGNLNLSEADTNIDMVQVNDVTSAVSPEPATFLLFGAAAIVFGLRSSRTRRA